MRRALTVVGVLLAYAVIYLVFSGPLRSFYTPGWSSQLIFVLFAPLSVLAALPARHRVAAWLATAGYAAGVAVGEVVGEAIYRAQVARLDEQLRDPAYRQDWEPSHPGWWITLLCFAVALVVGLAIDHRRARVAGPRATLSAATPPPAPAGASRPAPGSARSRP